MEKIDPNKLKVIINGTNYAKHVPFPFKYGQLLDRQLDSGNLTVIKTTEKIFKPFTPVTTTMWNEKTPSVKRELEMFVAADESVEIPAGSGKYNHTLSLIEPIKLFEGIFPRSHGYVNALSATYYAQTVFPVYGADDGGDEGEDIRLLLKGHGSALPNLYTPYDKDFPSAKALFPSEYIRPEVGSITIKSNDKTVFVTTDLESAIPLPSLRDMTITYTLNEYYYLKVG